MKSCFLILLLFSGTTFAASVSESLEEDTRINYKIDWKYTAGEYLIYDCERSNYACVNKAGNENCQEERKFAMEEKTEKLPCAPLKKFQNKESCVREHYKVVDIGALKRFCYPK